MLHNSFPFFNLYPYWFSVRPVFENDTQYINLGDGFGIEDMYRINSPLNVYNSRRNPLNTHIAILFNNLNDIRYHTNIYLTKTMPSEMKSDFMEDAYLCYHNITLYSGCKSDSKWRTPAEVIADTKNRIYSSETRLGYSSQVKKILGLPENYQEQELTTDNKPLRKNLFWDNAPLSSVLNDKRTDVKNVISKKDSTIPLPVHLCIEDHISLLEEKLSNNFLYKNLEKFYEKPSMVDVMDKMLWESSITPCTAVFNEMQERRRERKTNPEKVGSSDHYANLIYNNSVYGALGTKNPKMQFERQISEKLASYITPSKEEQEMARFNQRMTDPDNLYKDNSKSHLVMIRPRRSGMNALRSKLEHDIKSCHPGSSGELIYVPKDEENVTLLDILSNGSPRITHFNDNVRVGYESYYDAKEGFSKSKMLIKSLSNTVEIRKKLGSLQWHYLKQEISENIKVVSISEFLIYTLGLLNIKDDFDQLEVERKLDEYMLNLMKRDFIQLGTLVNISHGGSLSFYHVMKNEYNATIFLVDVPTLYHRTVSSGFMDLFSTIYPLFLNIIKGSHYQLEWIILNTWYRFTKYFKDEKPLTIDAFMKQYFRITDSMNKLYLTGFKFDLLGIEYEIFMDCKIRENVRTMQDFHNFVKESILANRSGKVLLHTDETLKTFENVKADIEDNLRESFNMAGNVKETTEAIKEILKSNDL